MGQQQLLLLVLATVIVGSATLAGIAAFGEKKQKATQDALVQRAMNLANDIRSAYNASSQLGGINLGTTDKADIATAIGLSSPTGISADGAGESAECEITSSTSETVKCGSDGSTGGDVTVTVDVDPDADDPVTVNTIDVSS